MVIQMKPGAGDNEVKQVAAAVTESGFDHYLLENDGDVIVVVVDYHISGQPDSEVLQKMPGVFMVWPLRAVAPVCA